ncbi:MAG: hypothetical protein J7L38_01590 [Thermoproteales archaeon]|nr:hypothetical protein [Thermoproteales archaeon]
MSDEKIFLKKVAVIAALTYMLSGKETTSRPKSTKRLRNIDTPISYWKLVGRMIHYR